MTKNEDISKPFKVLERQTLEVEHVVEKNKYFTILFFSQLYTQLDTCQKFHPYAEPRMLRLARLDHVRNVDIWQDAHMYPISEFLREKRLRWFWTCAKAR